ncbi:phosphate signaling complex protein PhoU [Neoroseomonas eburnea]
MTDRVPHTVHRFDDELDALRALVRRMGVIAEEQVSDATRALFGRDAALANRVLAREPELDALERQIEAQVIRLLALRHPMAADLRLAIAGLKISHNLERVGDYAANAAKRAIVLSGLPMVGSLNGFERLAQMVTDNLRSAVGAFAGDDIATADRVWAADAPVDDVYTGIFRELLTHMIEDPRNITAATHLLFIAKNLERVGDHATNIAETVHFAVRGDQLPSDRPKADSSATTVVEPGDE